METSLNLQILDLENESKQLRHELERVKNERDRMLQENTDMGRDKSGTEAERLKLKVNNFHYMHRYNVSEFHLNF